MSDNSREFTRVMVRVTVNLADGVSAHATHVKRSERDWQDVDDRAWVACELHYIVKTHDLILHSE